MAISVNNRDGGYRPGVYMRFANRGQYIDPVMVPYDPGPGEDSGKKSPVVTVNLKGVMSASNNGLSLGSGNGLDGYTVVISSEINAKVSGGTMVVTNPAG